MATASTATRPEPVAESERECAGPLRALIARYAARRWVQALGYAVAAGWAGAFPLVSHIPNQAFWGLAAAPAYGLAALLSLGLPRPAGGRAAALVAVLGAVLVPLAVLVVQGEHQSEVTVVERSARLLLHTGSPYLSAPLRYPDYDPYLPAMALFGLPRALLGDAGPVVRVLGDARIWFALVFTGCLLACWRLLRPPRGAVRPPLLLLAVLTASPLVAPSLVAGGVDLPLIGLCCLAMALADRGRPVATGLVLALACSLKWTAWPALPVALLLLHHRYGRRPAVGAAAIAVAGSCAVILPVALTHARVVGEQVVRFPLGLATVHTPAGSPLPGELLAELGPAGHAVSLALLCLGGLAVAVRLLTDPPDTAVAACDLLAAGLTVAFVLAPAGRFGYLALPVLLALWPRLAAGGAADG